MFVKLYAIAFTVFFVIDMIWLGFLAKNFYRAQIGSLMKSDVNWAMAIIFLFGFYHFCRPKEVCRALIDKIVL